MYMIIDIETGISLISFFLSLDDAINAVKSYEKKAYKEKIYYIIFNGR